MLTCTLASCVTPQIPVRTIPEDQATFNTSLGLSFININLGSDGSSTSQSPWPTTSLGFSYGVTDDITVGTNLYPLSLAYLRPVVDITGSATMVTESGIVPQVVGMVGVNGGFDLTRGNSATSRKVTAGVLTGITASYTSGENRLLYLGGRARFVETLINSQYQVCFGSCHKVMTTSKVRYQAEVSVLYTPFTGSNKLVPSFVLGIIIPL